MIDLLDRLYRDGKMQKNNKKHDRKKNKPEVTKLQAELEELVKNRPGFDDIMARTRYALEKERLEGAILRAQRSQNGDPRLLQTTPTWVK